MGELIRKNLIIKRPDLSSMADQLKEDLHKTYVEPEHLLILLDGSGSMEGSKWEQLVKATVAINAEAGNSEMIYKVYNNEIKDFCVEDLHTFLPCNGTAMLRALKSCLSLEVGRIILVTDGKQTDCQDQDLLAFAESLNHIIIDTVGIGEGCNKELLTLISELTGGKFIYCDEKYVFELEGKMIELSPERRMLT